MKSQTQLFERVLKLTEGGIAMRAAVDMVLLEAMGEILDKQIKIEKILIDVTNEPVCDVLEMG